jgi:hypothetical protein
MRLFTSPRWIWLSPSSTLLSEVVDDKGGAHSTLPSPRCLFALHGFDARSVTKLVVFFSPSLLTPRPTYACQEHLGKQ